MIRTVSALLLCLPLAVSAQDKFPLKIRHDIQGESTDTAKESKKVEKVVVADATGNVLQDQSKTTLETNKYKQTVVAKKGDDKPTKVTREYSEATTTVDGESSKQAFHGKTVTIDRKGDDYTFTVDGKELPTESLGELGRNFQKGKASDADFDRIMLPKDKVAAGETWKIDVAAFAKLLGDANSEDSVEKSFDIEKSKASGKLVKAYQKDGKLFGVLEYTFVMPMKMLQGKMPCKDGSTLELSMKMEGCLDGSQAVMSGEMGMKIKGEAEVVENDKPTGVMVKFDIQNSETNKTMPAK